MSKAKSSILLADFGGTNARFAILEDGDIGCIALYPVAKFATPLDALRAYLAAEGNRRSPAQAVFAAAGPIADGKVSLTNAPWEIDSETIRHILGLQSVELVNDFEALAWSIPALAPRDLYKIGGGSPAVSAPVAAIGPGTGFGVAALIHHGLEELALVTEGGHATIAGENRREDSIIQKLRDWHGHVSIERVLSGNGLVHLYRAVAALDGLTVPERSTAEIVAFALNGKCRASRAALELFCALLGSSAGNIALTLGARGGVFIGGGLAPRFAEFLGQSAFRRHFEAKGRMSGYVATVPTCVIMHAHPAFLGLARMLQGRRRLHGERAASADR